MSSETLSNKEIKKLTKLGKNILASLSCDVNGQGIPCRTDRFTAVENMIEYLKIHNFKFLGEDQLVEFYKDTKYRNKKRSLTNEEKADLRSGKIEEGSLADIISKKIDNEEEKTL